MSAARHANTSAQRAEIAARIRLRAAQDMTHAQVAEAMDMTRTAVQNICDEYNIHFAISGLRKRTKVQHRLDEDGLIEAAILKLRRGKYAPVCAMYTIRRPAMVPQPYHHGMTFRVGTERNVPLARLFEMAGALP